MAAPGVGFPRECPVYLHPVQEGEARTSNPYPDYIQRENIHQSPPDSNFEVVINLLSCIHGTLDAEQNVPASLIIFEFFYFIKSGSARVRQASFRFDFFNKDPKKQISGPSVIAWAPFRFEERSDMSNEQIELMKRLEATFGADYLAKLGITGAVAKKLSYTDQFYERGVAVRRADYFGTRFPTMQWNLYESKKSGTRPGLAANFRAAVLLKRPKVSPEDPFVGVFNMDFDTGIWNNWKNEYADWRKNTALDDPINFSPQEPAFNNFASVDPAKLGLFADGTSLRVLTQIPGFQPMQPTTPNPSNQ